MLHHHYLLREGRLHHGDSTCAARPAGEHSFGPVVVAADTTLIKTESIEVIRVVMSKGKELARHKVHGEITLQCLAGSVTLRLGDHECELSPGMLTYLSGGQEHSLSANADSALLLTIFLGQIEGSRRWLLGKFQVPHDRRLVSVRGGDIDFRRIGPLASNRAAERLT